MKKPTLTIANNKIISPISTLDIDTVLNCIFDEKYLTDLNQYKISNIIKYKLK